MMFAELHFPSLLPVDRDDVEDALNEVGGDLFEVTGAGVGISGSNLDLEVSGEIPEAIRQLTAIMKRFDIRDARVIFDGMQDYVQLGPERLIN